jgi:RNA polymerase sigma-70 factor (ECF subfamily)
MIGTQTSLDEDAHLMLEAAAGNSEAYGRLYRKYFPVVVSFVSGFKVLQQVAEDVAQDVFTRVWQNRAQYQPAAAFRTYLLGCARNVCCEYRSRAIREITVRGVLEAGETSVARENDGSTAPLKKLVERLPARQKQAVEIVYLLELSTQQAAERLRCSVHSIHQSLYLARQNLRKSMTSLLP